MVPMESSYCDSSRNDTEDTDMSLFSKKDSQKWDRIAIVLAFTALLALLSVSYFSVVHGKFFPQTFKNSWSYVLFLMVINLVFYFPVIGFILSKKHPNIAKIFSCLSLVGLVLSFTVLSWRLLPPHFNWFPWVFLVLTLGALVYQCICQPWSWIRSLSRKCLQNMY